MLYSGGGGGWGRGGKSFTNAERTPRSHIATTETNLLFFSAASPSDYPHGWVKTDKLLLFLCLGFMALRDDISRTDIASSSCEVCKV